MTADTSESAAGAALAFWREIFGRLGLRLDTLRLVEIGAADAGPGGETWGLAHDHGAHRLFLPFDAATADAIAGASPAGTVDRRLVGLPPRDAHARAAAVATALDAVRPHFVGLDLAAADDALLGALDLTRRAPAVVRLRGDGRPSPAWAAAFAGAGLLAFPHPLGGIVAVDRRVAGAKAPPAAEPVRPEPARAEPVSPDPAPTVADRPRLASFDVFDTLIARRCLEPWRIFAAVGERAGIADFVERRRAAEARVAIGPHDIDDIYAELGRDLGLAAETTEALKRLEIETELDAVVPIAQNLDRVRDGDLLVSDMYLPPAVVRALLARAGLERQTGLVVTSAGKHDGWIWPKLAARVEITEHLGDNPHSDVASPRKHGVPARHTTLSALAPVEKLLVDRGLRDLALCAREARLATWSDDPRQRMLQLIQAGLNFPILFLASIVLARHAVAVGADRVLFSARDCNLWIHVFGDILRRTGTAVDVRYLLTSRLARMRGSDDYLAYVRDSLGERAVVADICGTGASLARLMPRLGRSGQRVFFIHRVLPEAGGVAPPPEGACTVTAMIDPSMGQFLNHVFEMANYAGHAMVEDVVAVEGCHLPRFAAEPRDAAALAAVAAQRATFMRALEISRRHRFDDAFGLDDATLTAVCRELYGFVCNQQVLLDVFARGHYAEDARVMDEIHAMSAHD